MVQALHHLVRRALPPAALCALPFRVSQFVAMQALKVNRVIEIKFGERRFKMLIQPLGPMQGSRGIFLFREHYEPLLNFGSSLLTRGGVALDLGANQGIYTCAFGSAVGPEGRVVSVEPIPRQVDRLETNTKLNGWSHVKVVSGAISDTVGEIDLRMNHGDTAASIVWGSTDTDKVIRVKTRTIDEIVAGEKLPKVDFIKIDVEGAEMLALRGAVQTLRSFRPILSIETSPESPEPVDFLRTLGYKMFQFDRRGKLVPVEKVDRLVDCLIARPAF